MTRVIVISREELQQLLQNDLVKQAMIIRCSEDGRHEWENCCSALFQVYQQCRWCGEIR